MSRLLLIPLVVLASLLGGCGGSSAPAVTAATGSTGATRTTPGPSATVLPPTPRRVTARPATWRLPYAVARAAVVGVGRGSVILAGGLLTGDLSTGRALRLDVGAGVARTLPPLVVAVHDTAAGLVADVPTVVGGGNATEQSVMQSWERGGWRPVGSLPTTRSDLSVVSWRRHAYVIGGYDGSSVPRSVLRLSSRVGPQRLGRLLRGVRYAATARIRSKVYVFGGEVAGRELDTVQELDLASGTTTRAGRLPVPLGHAMAVAVGDRILLMGGRVAPDRQTGQMWWFDPATNRFHRAGRLPSRLSDAAVASDGGRVWLLGGETPAVTDQVVVLRVG